MDLSITIIDILLIKINNHLLNHQFENIIYTRYINYKESPFVNILNWHAMVEPKEQEFCVEFLDKAKVIEKSDMALNRKIF